MLEDGQGRAFWGGGLRATQLSVATRQLASLLAAGLPLEQALAAVVEQADRPNVRDRFAAVRGEVVAGQTFSLSLIHIPEPTRPD